MDGKILNVTPRELMLGALILLGAFSALVELCKMLDRLHMADEVQRDIDQLPELADDESEAA